MTSPYYKDAYRFSPSKDTLQLWMNTRKPSNSNFDGPPGLFTTVEYSKDLAWTMVAGFIELLALGLTTYGALNHYAQQQNTAVLFVTIIAVILFVAFDVIGVLLHGADRYTKVIASGKATVVNDPQKKKDLIRLAEQGTPREFFGTVFLILSAFIKIAAVSILFAIGATLPMIVVLVMFYLTVIYIHIAHTGYWLEARKTSNRIRREWEAWWKDEQQGGSAAPIRPQKIVFRSPEPLQHEQFQHGRQTVRTMRTVEENGVQMFELELESKGIMWDEDVTALLSNFVVGGWLWKALKEACIRMQLQHIDIVPG